MRAVNVFHGRSTARPKVVGEVATPPAGKTTIVVPSLRRRSASRRVSRLVACAVACRGKVDRQRIGPDLGHLHEVVVDQDAIGPAEAFDQRECAEAVEDAIGVVGDHDQWRLCVERWRPLTGCDIHRNIDQIERWADDRAAIRNDFALPDFIIRHEVVAPGKRVQQSV